MLIEHPEYSLSAIARNYDKSAQHIQSVLKRHLTPEQKRARREWAKNIKVGSLNDKLCRCEGNEEALLEDIHARR